MCNYIECCCFRGLSEFCVCFLYFICVCLLIWCIYMKLLLLCRAVYFYAYANSKQFLNTVLVPDTMLVHIISAACAGGIKCVVCFALEFFVLHWYAVLKVCANIQWFNDDWGSLWPNLHETEIDASFYFCSAMLYMIWPYVCLFVCIC